MTVMIQGEMIAVYLCVYKLYLITNQQIAVRTTLENIENERSYYTLWRF